jgi:heat shock protein 1/8
MLIHNTIQTLDINIEDCVQVKKMLSEMFSPEKVCDNVNPDEIVAFGAGVRASAAAGLKETLLLDVTPHDLGIASFGDVMVIP